MHFIIIPFTYSHKVERNSLMTMVRVRQYRTAQYTQLHTVQIAHEQRKKNTDLPEVSLLAGDNKNYNYKLLFTDYSLLQYRMALTLLGKSQYLYEDKTILQTK